MMSPYEVVIKPLIMTEKGEIMREDENKYLFKVSVRANKNEIKNAVEKLFNVEVDDVNTLMVRGKVSRMGRRMGKRPNWKKAIVTLKEGETIEFFEGV